MAQRLDARRIARLIAAFDRVRLLVVGDVMLDEYLWGDVERVSPEAPVPVVHVKRESQALGGAGNVARNIAALGGSAALCAVVGRDTAGRRVVDLLKHRGVDPTGIVEVDGRPTTRKTRLEARAQQIVRFDRETTRPLPRTAARGLAAQVEARLPSVHALVLEDYGKGVLPPSTLRALIQRARAVEVPVYVDPKGDLTPCRGAALVKPNLPEAEALAGVSVGDRADLDRVLQKLRRLTRGAAVVVTRGAEGMSFLDGEGPSVDVPTAAPEVFDKQGCGDTSIAALALARCAGASLLEAAVIANAAAGVVARKVGTATVTPEELGAFVPDVIEAVRGGPARARAARAGKPEEPA